ncbi:acyl-CoA dehydrogenase family protein [soil metagenome]
MDFGWTEEQKQFHETVVTFAQRELNDDIAESDEAHQFRPDAWKKCAAFGLPGLPVPEQYGGSGADIPTVALALEGLGYGCRDNGLIFSLNAHMWSCQLPVLKSGTEDQKRRYLPGLCDGSLIGVQGMTEPESGSDALALRTSAVRRGDRYVLNGTKTFITNAPVAGLFVVFATTDPTRGFAGLSAFLVERDAPGLTIGTTFHKMGLHTSPMSELVFDDCEVGDDAVLGRAGAGMAIFNASMEWERSFILAASVGTMQRQLERCVAYARQRRQFGQPIGKFQAVSHRIVDMALRVKTARLMLYELAWLKEQGRSTAMESAMVKLWLSECFVQCSLDALQVQGAFGYMVESEIERDVRDALAGRIYSGTSDIQRNIVASRLRL